MKIKIPNILTIGRIIIVPFFVISFFLPGFYGEIIPFLLFILASFTDFLDGLLARLYKEESKLGELLDPIADKIIVAAALNLKKRPVARPPAQTRAPPDLSHCWTFDQNQPAVSIAVPGVGRWSPKIGRAHV